MDNETNSVIRAAIHNVESKALRSLDRVRPLFDRIDNAIYNVESKINAKIEGMKPCQFVELSDLMGYPAALDRSIVNAVFVRHTSVEHTHSIEFVLNGGSVAYTVETDLSPEDLHRAILDRLNSDEGSF